MVDGKSVTVEDFRGVSISPTISKVVEHCILCRCYIDSISVQDTRWRKGGVILKFKFTVF